MTILAIETSCDETAAAVMKARGDPASLRFKILSNVVSSQVKIHRPFGGVVPNLAKRAHQENLIPVLRKALGEARLLKNPVSRTRNHEQIQNTEYQTLNTVLEREDILRPKVLKFLARCAKPEIDVIAVTYGPGLAPALWPGINLARVLAYFWQKPLIGINHLEGHIFANWLEPIQDARYKMQDAKKLFPAVCLVVSGGHTQLILMKNFGKYQLIGETRDDAAGECFDKAAKILGLDYPGGPAIAACAARSRIKNSPKQNKFAAGQAELRIKLPRPMMNTKDYDFSFSGLKTAVLYLVKEIEKSQELTETVRDGIAAECQQSIIDVLISKTLRAAGNFRAKTVIISGGVAANEELRKQFAAAIQKRMSGKTFRAPAKKFCTDNAAMVAVAGYIHALKKNFVKWRELKADANLRLA